MTKETTTTTTTTIAVNYGSLPTPPPSTFIPLPSTNALESFESLLLPPPSENYLPSPRINYYNSSSTLINKSFTHSNNSRRGSNHTTKNILNDSPPPQGYETSESFPSNNSSPQSLIRATPTSLVLSGSNDNINNQVMDTNWPTRGYFSEKDSIPPPQASLPSVNDSIQHSRLPSLPSSILSSSLPAPILKDSIESTTTTATRNGGRGRARRAFNSKAPIPRQLSPFELSPNNQLEIEEEIVPTTSSTSNRKVSHSLIERRRREKINDCLGRLRQMVPQCRTEARAKEARAKERSRKRGRNNNNNGDDEQEEGARGGLHKLQILVGTISYIEELESRLAAYGEDEGVRKIISEPQTYSSSSDDLVLSPPKSRGPPTDRGFKLPVSIVHNPGSNGQNSSSSSSSSTAVELDDRAAGLLLLKFSTSPELRPVFFSD